MVYERIQTSRNVHIILGSRRYSKYHSVNKQKINYEKRRTNQKTRSKGNPIHDYRNERPGMFHTLRSIPSIESIPNSKRMQNSYKNTTLGHNMCRVLSNRNIRGTKTTTRKIKTKWQLSRGANTRGRRTDSY